jgi:DNA-binding NarL/FixJ family response regulator
LTNGSGAILVVDASEEFCAFASELLEGIGYRTLQRTRGAEALLAAEAHRPAGVILEVELPDLDGYEVCTELRERFGDGLAIVFTSAERTGALDQAAGLLLGADDYLAKPVEAAELVARVRRLVDRPRARSGPTDPQDRLAALTRREREVLTLLGDGYQQEDIARRLVISPKTVGTHIQRILTKLDVRSRTQAVALALRDERQEVPGDIAV